MTMFAVGRGLFEEENPWTSRTSWSSLANGSSATVCLDFAPLSTDSGYSFGGHSCSISIDAAYSRSSFSQSSAR